MLIELDRNESGFVLVTMNIIATLRNCSIALLAAGGCAPGITRSPVPSSSMAGSGEDGESASSMACGTTPDSRSTDATDLPSATSRPVAIRPPVERRPEPLASPYFIRVVDEGNAELPRFSRDGRAYLLGTRGTRYQIVVSNLTSRRVEAVISVDGLDAIDGGPADYVHKNGYLLPAHGSITVEGFRTSLDRVATFRFSSVAGSYAGRLGQARDVGVIGVAFFPERMPIPIPMARAAEPTPVQSPHAAPAQEESAASAPAPKRAASESASGGPLSDGVAAESKRRPGLGTEFGESRDSRVEEVAFERANQSTPAHVSTIRYNDRAGLLALGIHVDPPDVSGAEVRTRETAEAFRANRFAAPPQ